MGSRQLPLGIVLLLLACTLQPATKPAVILTPTAPASPGAATRVTLRAPAADILTDQEAGLPRAAGADHIGLAQAAEQEQNQPLALTRLRSWGLVEEASRSWGDGTAGADEALLLLTRDEGAGLAYLGLSAEVVSPPLQSSPCPAAVRADDCVEGRSGNHSVIVARVGTYVFRFRAVSADVERLGALQASRIRLP